MITLIWGHKTIIIKHHILKHHIPNSRTKGAHVVLKLHLRVPARLVVDDRVPFWGERHNTIW